MQQKVQLQRVRQIKEWQRAWKIELIEQTNPDWSDLFLGIVA